MDLVSRQLAMLSDPSPTGEGRDRGEIGARSGEIWGRSGRDRGEIEARSRRDRGGEIGARYRCGWRHSPMHTRPPTRRSRGGHEERLFTACAVNRHAHTQPHAAARLQVPGRRGVNSQGVVSYSLSSWLQAPGRRDRPRRRHGLHGRYRRDDGQAEEDGDGLAGPSRGGSLFRVASPRGSNSSWFLTCRFSTSRWTCCSPPALRRKAMN